MKKTVLLALLVFLAFPFSIGAAEADHDELNRIEAGELKRLIDKENGFILIDSRDSGKYNSGHIKGAANIHYDPSEDPNIRNMTLMALPMDRLIIIYDDGENEKKSVGLAMDLYDMGCDIENLKILSGGIAQWKKQGYPLITAGE